MEDKKILTTSNGNPVDSNQNSITSGPNGPVALMDFHLIDKLSHFDRERIPERVVHAKGAGAHGYFEVTHDVTKYCKAKFLSSVGKKTPIFTRFSTVGGEKGSADTERDPRGFAVKFYTEEGNWDMVGNNTPVFFIRDPLKFPDLIHTQKRNPQTNCKDPDMFWDFFSLVPETCHQVTILFSDRGIPYGYRHMNGYGSHTFKWVNADGAVHYVKFHFTTDQGIKNFTSEEAAKMNSDNPDFATKDLFDAIEKGENVSWTAQVQIMPEADAEKYKWNVLDVTKVWPHADYPLIPYGKMVLNKNPLNYFQDVEQAAFSPSNVVPGIEPSNDKMLQGRLFSYPDTHRHRLGPNFHQIPINCPHKAQVHNGQRDGLMSVNGNQGNAPNYEPNSYGHQVESLCGAYSSFKIDGLCQRSVYTHPNSDFEQAGELYRTVMNADQKTILVNNIIGHLKNANKKIQEKQVKIFTKCDAEYGKRIAEGLGISL